ncbi:hypothetical protein ABID65_009291 [Bradyrhizobium sp. S3.9.2]
MLAGSSAISTYTMATIQASFANAAEFFNSLLGSKQNEERPKLSYRSVNPLDAGRLPTFN